MYTTAQKILVSFRATSFILRPCVEQIKRKRARGGQKKDLSAKLHSIEIEKKNYGGQPETEMSFGSSIKGTMSRTAHLQDFCLN